MLIRAYHAQSNLRQNRTADDYTSMRGPFMPNVGKKYAALQEMRPGVKAAAAVLDFSF